MFSPSELLTGNECFDYRWIYPMSTLVGRQAEFLQEIAKATGTVGNYHFLSKNVKLLSGLAVCILE